MAVIVRTGVNEGFNPSGITAALPVTIITAMVSPSERPIPSMTRLGCRCVLLAQ